MMYAKEHISNHNNNEAVEAWLAQYLSNNDFSFASPPSPRKIRHSRQVFTPPASFAGLNRKHRTDNMESPKSNRKRKQGDRRHAPLLDLGDMPSLASASSRSIRSPKGPSSVEFSNHTRSTSPTKDLLNVLRMATPSVDCQGSGAEMPAKAMKLRNLLSKDFGEGIIPSSLKVSWEFRGHVQVS